MSIPFNDTSNKSGLIQLCEQYTGLGDGNISGNATLLKQFTRGINNAYQKIVTIIFESQDDWEWDDIGTTDGTTASRSDYPVATVSLVAGQRDYTFPLSLKLMKIQRVDVSYNGSTFYRCTPWDSQETSLGLGNDSDVDARYTQTNPVYDVRANSVWLYPRGDTTSVTAGGVLRIEFLREPVEFASTNTANTPGIDTAFQPMLALDASIDYCMVNSPSLIGVLSSRYSDMESRLRKYYSRKNEDTVYQVKSQYINYN